MTGHSWLPHRNSNAALSLRRLQNLTGFRSLTILLRTKLDACRQQRTRECQRRRYQPGELRPTALRPQQPGNVAANRAA